MNAWSYRCAACGTRLHSDHRDGSLELRQLEVRVDEHRAAHAIAHRTQSLPPVMQSDFILRVGEV